MTMREYMEDAGWSVEQFHAWQQVGKYEVSIEFCFGDCCVGVFEPHGDDMDLVEGKFREKTLTEALIKANELVKKYAKLGY